MRESWRAAVGGLVYFIVTACSQNTPDTPLDPSSALSFDGANASSEVARMQHGERLSGLLGCTGCHNPEFSGGAFNEGRIAPNVSLMTSEYDEVRLDRAIRQGIALDGHKIRLMPSEMYRSLSSADVKALSSYLLALEPSGNVQPEFEPTPSDISQWAADGYIDGNALGLAWENSAGPLDVGARHSRGRYLATNLCTECHNNQLQGYPNFTPDLIIVSSYTDEELKRLLNEGKGNIRDELGLMTIVSPARFPHLTESEYSDLVSYLRVRSETLLEE